MGAGWGTLPVEYYFASTAHTYPRKNDFQMPYYNATGDYELQAFISEYMIDSGLYVLSKEGLLNFQDDTLTDTEFWALLLPIIKEKFGAKNPCQLNIVMTDPEPRVQLLDEEMKIKLSFTNDLKCSNTTISPKFEQVATFSHTVTLDIDVSTFLTYFSLTFRTI